METKFINQIIEKLEMVLDAQHQGQVARAQKIAHTLRPDLTTEDLLNPDNFKEIIGDPDYMYEDGQAAGILSAKMAVRATLKEMLVSGKLGY